MKNILQNIADKHLALIIKNGFVKDSISFSEIYEYWQDDCRQDDSYPNFLGSLLPKNMEDRPKLPFSKKELLLALNNSNKLPILLGDIKKPLLDSIALGISEDSKYLIELQKVREKEETKSKKNRELLTSAINKLKKARLNSAEKKVLGIKI